MKYGLFVRGHLLRLTPRLSEIMSSPSYEPWNHGTEVWEFRYDAERRPITATLL